MIFFYIILAVATVGVGYAVTAAWTDSWNELFDKVMTTFFSLFMAVAAGALTFTILQLLMYGIVGEHMEKTGESDLASLADNQGTSGSFFLGSGSIDDEPVFYYYERNGDEYTLEHVNADEAVVIETTDDPRVEFYSPVSNNEFWYIGGFGESTVKFYVPEGSVLNNYNLDAE